MDDSRLPENQTARRGRGRGVAFQLAAVALTVVSALAGTGLARWLRGPADGSAVADKKADRFPGRALEGWDRPDLVLLFTGQQHGYVLPCGCSRPQVGGLERRYNFIQLMKREGWPVVGIDLGDIAQRQAPMLDMPNQQGMIKYDYSMRALKRMGYRAVSFGEHEISLGLMNVLTQFALNEPVPRVVAGNLMDAEKHFPGMTKPWELVEEAGVRLGITAIVSPTTATRIKGVTAGDDKVKFEETKAALNRVLAEMKAAGVKLPVLLYLGPVTRNAMKRPPTEAMACAEAYPQFPVIVCLNEEDEPSSQPVKVTTPAGTTTLVITLGRKGKFVGAVGLWKKADGSAHYELRYERVEMIQDLETDKDQVKGHPILDLMEEYTRELKEKDYLAKYTHARLHELQMMQPVPDIKGEPTYAGSDRCAKCHKASHKIWQGTPHAHAYQTLVDATRPGNRQYDPECIVCHTVGFRYKGGFENATKTPNLKDVGCESCHGPSSLHVANPHDPTWQKRINPWKYLPASQRKDRIDQFCQKCHDQDNDVTWVGGGFERKWPKVKHYEGPDPMLEKSK